MLRSGEDYSGEEAKKVDLSGFFEFLSIYRGQNGWYGHNSGLLEPDPHLFEVVCDGYNTELAGYFWQASE